MTAANDPTVMPSEVSSDPVNDSILVDSYDSISLSSLKDLNDMTPRMLKASVKR